MSAAGLVLVVAAAVLRALRAVQPSRTPFSWGLFWEGAALCVATGVALNRTRCFGHGSGALWRGVGAGSLTLRSRGVGAGSLTLPFKTE